MPQIEFLDVLIRLIAEEVSLNVSLDGLPPDGGLYAEAGVSQTVSGYYDKTAIWTVPVLFLSKSPDQREGLMTLSRICGLLHKKAEYPSGESFNWMDAQVITQPNKIGRSEDQQYLFSCIVNCKLFF